MTLTARARRGLGLANGGQGRLSQGRSLIINRNNKGNRIRPMRRLMRGCGPPSLARPAGAAM